MKLNNFDNLKNSFKADIPSKIEKVDILAKRLTQVELPTPQKLQGLTGDIFQIVPKKITINEEKIKKGVMERETFKLKNAEKPVQKALNIQKPYPIMPKKKTVGRKIDIRL